MENTINCPHCQSTDVRIAETNDLELNGKCDKNIYELADKTKVLMACDTCKKEITVSGVIKWIQPEITASAYTIKCPYCESTKVRMHNPSCLCETAYPSSPYVFDHVADTQAICDDCGKHSSVSGEIVWKQPEKID